MRCLVLLVVCLPLCACAAAGTKPSPAKVAGRPARASVAARRAAAATPTWAPAARKAPSALAPLLRRAAPRLVAGVPIGRSAHGRVLRLNVSGNPAAPSRLLVVGCVHGDECAGAAVARRVAPWPGACPPTNGDVWAIASLDPDGRAAGSRLNGRGVDLNRNFPAGWRPIGRPGDLEHSGRRPFSEPETRTAREVIRAAHPQVTIWFHQEAEPLVRAWGPSVAAARRYARLTGLPFRHMHWLAGTAPHWQNTAFAGSVSFVVELAAGPLPPAAARRHARAALALAGIGVARGGARG